MNYLFTLCARAGSKGFKNKNLKNFCGYPLAYYSLAAVKVFANRHSDDHIVVAANTDSNEFAQLFKQQQAFGNVVIIKREAELAGDDIAKVMVIQDTYKRCKKEGNFDAIIDLDITSPIRSVIDIENAINVFNQNKCDLVFSVCPSRRNPYFNMVEQDGNGKCKRICDSNFTSRQQAPKVYDLNASVYIYNPQILSSVIDKTILDFNFEISVMDDFLVLDIDSEEDYKMMQYIYKYCLKSNKLLKEVYKMTQLIDESKIVENQ